MIKYFSLSENAFLMMVFVVMIAFFVPANAQIITEEKTQNHVCTEDKDMIIGKTTLDAISQNHNFWSEYLLHYGEYETDKTVIEQISQLLEGKIINVTVVIGTWCGDSKEQFPVFEKVIEQLSKDVFSIEIIGVDRDKLAGDLDISSLNIEFVPTFIFYENGEELGRIVEIPSETMEKDILNILSKNQ